MLTYDEKLDTTGDPDKSAFTVKVEEVTRSITAVSIRADQDSDPGLLVITLGSVVRPGESVTVSYTVPSTNPIKDAADNEAAAFTDFEVSNDLAAEAPEAPGNLVATATHADKVTLTWTVPWDNGSAITRFEYRGAVGNSVPASVAWTAVPDSGPTTTGFSVVLLAPGTEHAFEIRAVNDEGNGDEAAATATTLTPTWSFTLRDSSNNDVTELTEGGASAIAVVRITNSVRFSSDQAVTLEWGGDEINTGLIQGANEIAFFDIIAGEATGALSISAPDRPGDLYRLPETATLTASIGGTQVGNGIELEYVDDEAKPVLTLGMRATFGQTERSTQLRQVEGGEWFIDGHLNRGYDTDLLISLQAEMTGATNKFPANILVTRNGKTVILLQFTPGVTVSLSTSVTLVDNSTAGDSSEHVFTIVPNPDYYTIGTPSSATLIILDNDAAPTAPRNLAAQSRDGSVVLTWDPPTSLATTEFARANGGVRARVGIGPIVPSTSRLVNTASTPPIARASEVSTSRIRACGCGERTITARAAPGAARSSVYRPWPVRNRWSSLRTTRRPIQPLLMTRSQANRRVRHRGRSILTASAQGVHLRRESCGRAGSRGTMRAPVLTVPGVGAAARSRPVRPEP